MGFSISGHLGAMALLEARRLGGSLETQDLETITGDPTIVGHHVTTDLLEHGAFAHIGAWYLGVAEEAGVRTPRQFFALDIQGVPAKQVRPGLFTDVAGPQLPLVVVGHYDLLPRERLPSNVVPFPSQQNAVSYMRDHERHVQYFRVDGGDGGCPTYYAAVSQAALQGHLGRSPQRLTRIDRSEAEQGPLFSRFSERFYLGGDGTWNLGSADEEFRE